jgi:hypothetical protein
LHGSGLSKGTPARANRGEADGGSTSRGLAPMSRAPVRASRARRQRVCRLRQAVFVPDGDGAHRSRNAGGARVFIVD